MARPATEDAPDIVPRAEPIVPSVDAKDGPAIDAALQAGRGGRSVLVTRVVGQVVSLASLAVLYRLVDPAEFGLVALSLTVVTVLRLVGASGLPAVIVQADRLDRRTYRRAIGLAVGLGGLATVAGIGAGPALAWLYGQPRLVPVTAALAATCLLAAWSAVVESRLERSLRFTSLSRLRLAAQILAAIATIGMASLGWGVWALVVGQVSELLLVGGLAGIAVRREPLPPADDANDVQSATPLERPVPRLARLRTTARASLTSPAVWFGSSFTLALLMTNVGQGVDKLVLGLLVADHPDGEAIVGQYAQAFNLFLRPVFLLAGAVGAVALPALAAVARTGEAASPGTPPGESDRLSTGAPDAFAALTASLFRAAAILLAPVAAGLTVTGGPVMVGIAGSDWETAGTLLMILAPAILPQGLINLCGPVLAARGRGGSLLVATMGWLAALTLGLLAVSAMPGRPTPLLAVNDAIRIAVLYTLVTYLTLPVYLSYALRHSGVAPGPIVTAILPSVFAAVLMAGCVLCVGDSLRRLGVPELESRGSIRIGVTAGLIGVGVVTYLFWAWREIVWLRQFLGASPPGTSARSTPPR